MSMVPTTIAGFEGSSSQSRLSANRPRSVEMGSPLSQLQAPASLPTPPGMFERSRSANRVA